MISSLGASARQVALRFNELSAGSDSEQSACRSGRVQYRGFHPDKSHGSDVIRSETDADRRTTNGGGRDYCHRNSLARRSQGTHS